MRLPRAVFSALTLSLALVSSLRAADEAAMERGRTLYAANCMICHGATGDGVRGTYPPLAKSDWLAANRTSAVRAVVSGLKAEITVNGTTYNGQMPPIVLDDPQVADVLTYVLNSWGNPGGAITTADVTAIRALTDFKSFAALKLSADYHPLPAPPPGFELKELVRLNEFGVRLASDGKGGPLYILGQSGGVWRFDVASGNLKQILWPRDFPDKKPGELRTLGMMLDPEGRLWITANQRVEAQPLVISEVTIYRTSTRDGDGAPAGPQVWFRTTYPWGIGPYTHGLSDIRLGPDGLLYASNGSRTDAGEQGEVANLGKMGEVETTAALWRFDPKAATPQLEVIARGIRNAYTFAWDGSGNLFTASNGPDAHAPEEMDAIVPPKRGEAPRHHGFPYQFGDAPADKKWYRHTPVPPAPENTAFVLPVLNLGPAGLMGGEPTSTFNAHSSPTGLVWLGNDWPESVRNGFLVGRLGSFLLGPAKDEEHGFDVLHLKMDRRADGRWTARTTSFLAELGRPIDVHIGGPGVLYVLEYTRPPSLKRGGGWLPGRILELRAKKS